MLDERLHDIPDLGVPDPGHPLRQLDEACRKAARDALVMPEVFASLTGTIRHIAADYRHRAVFELIQNAHDALGGEGQDEIRITFSRTVAGTSGELIVANRGRGFTGDNVRAVRLPARSTKSYGEGIGNKGLGFRSVMSLTDVPEVYSCIGEGRRRDRFDGYCFRFADDGEALALFRGAGATADQAAAFLRDVPRSMLSVPLPDQPGEIVCFAQEGFATVVRIRLRDAVAVADVEAQLAELRDADVPPTLFLDRIGTLSVEARIEEGKSATTRITRRATPFSTLSDQAGGRIEKVRINGADFLVVRREVARVDFEAAVRASLKDDERLQDWLRSTAPVIVSVAVPLNRAKPRPGRVYCYLPLGPGVEAPLLGHVDAPFLASLNRKDFHEGVPLNVFLLQACAGVALAAARFLVSDATGMPDLDRRAVADLICWRRDKARYLLAGNGGRPFLDEPLLPTAGGGWASLRKARAWKGRRAMLTAPVVAVDAGAPLLDNRLGDERLARIAGVRGAFTVNEPLEPRGAEVAGWIVAVAERRSSHVGAWRGWDRFLDAVVGTFEDLDLDLSELAGRKVLYGGVSGKTPKLLATQTDRETPVYLWDRGSGRGRARDVRMPPRALSRRVAYLDQRIALAPDTRAALVKAGLASEMDPVRILADHRRIAAVQPKPDTLVDILSWAYEVWTALGKEVEPVLRGCRLRVPTREGAWIEAADALLSACWSEDGRRLEAVIGELQEVSNDASMLARALVADPGATPFPESLDDRRAWREFLIACGVRDGLQAIPYATQARGSAHVFWKSHLMGVSAQKVDPHWVADVAGTTFRFPYSDYVSRSAHGLGFCRLPCQVEHDALSPEGKVEYAGLVLGYLRRTDPKSLVVAVFHATRGDHRDLPTPALSFLRRASWMPATARSGLGFAPPAKLWGRRARIREIPRPIRRPHEDMRERVVEEGIWQRLLGLGLGDWGDGATAARRLGAIASVVATAPPGAEDRSVIRAANATAWDDLVARRGALPSQASILVGAGDGFANVSAGSERVYVTSDMASLEARILQERGARILEGVGNPAAVAEILSKAGFAALPLSAVEVSMQADGVRFVPSAADPRLPAGGRGWLVDLAVLALDIEGRGLAVQVPRPTFRRNLRKVRLHFCRDLAVVIDGGEPARLPERIVHLRDREHPTLLVIGNAELAWEDLKPLARGLERLVDGRADGALRVAFATVAGAFSGTAFERPPNEALARALDWPTSRVEQAFGEVGAGTDHLREMAAPVLFCLEGHQAALDLVAALEQAEDEFDLASWLRARGLAPGGPPEEFAAACRSGEDRDALRRRFGIAFATFNAALASLGQDPLRNRADLRGQFEYACRAVRNGLVERLRRHHHAAYVAGGPLDAYAAARKLPFLSFDETWMTTVDVVDEALVRGFAEAAMESEFGTPPNVDLEPLALVRAHNDEAARDAVRQATPLVIAWCDRARVTVPDLWRQSPVDVVRRLDEAGALDFERVSGDGVVRCLAMSDLWPMGMQVTLDRNAHGLAAKQVEDARNWRVEQQRRREAERRRVSVGDTEYDAGSKTDMARLVATARAEAQADAGWEDRCGRVTLEEMAGAKARQGGGAGRGGSRAPLVVSERRMSEAQRSAIGLLGETRALEWIARRHKLTPEEAEAAWRSPNRAVSLLGDGGDDGLGYDFEVVRASGVRWRYEVKASTWDPCEFELGSSEVRAALEASSDKGTHFRVLYVPHVATPGLWRVVELPNPLTPAKRGLFAELGRAAIRFGFTPR
ncbi:ATP-binding protein [Methylobacterium sp. J-001]|uniref:ATP-binding protein n=1 Tax=Methylobacterium sp. J-001 TaxID=2836609 RepID=UPI001FB8E26C|nr:ATP-binding protein [Methylobacterium sp. J-001]MCJ2117021.1 ATP-binding protein [Methylobacterium sp. J-001]